MMYAETSINFSKVQERWPFEAQKNPRYETTNLSYSCKCLNGLFSSLTTVNNLRKLPIKRVIIQRQQTDSFRVSLQHF
jgi:hypothetical protein